MLGNNLAKKIKALPKAPGVYFFFDKNRKLIYVGKATSLRNRVKSYFIGAHDNKTEKLVSEISNLKLQPPNKF